MKLINKFLVVAAIAVTFTAVNRAMADDALLSPRAKANQTKTVTGTTADLLDRSVKAGSPKAQEMAASLRKVSGMTEDRLDRSYAGIPKLKEQAGTGAKEFQVAPLK